MQFSSIIGQQETIQHLLKTKYSGRISHAQLFCGKAGFGGLAIAIAYAQYLFCESPSETDSCGVCPACKKCENLQHPDLHFAFPTVLSVADKSDLVLKDWRQMVLNSPYFDLNQWTLAIDEKGRKPVIGTAESQEIIKKLALKSYEGGYKIMLIWMAEEMNTTCANKLLKIIEEPPEKTLFILLCESNENMLSTIISRSQLLNLSPISSNELKKALIEKNNVAAETADHIAALASGDFVDAQRFVVQQESGSLIQDWFIKCMRVSYKKEVSGMINWSNEIATEGRENQKFFLKYALHMFRQSVLYNYTNNQLTQTTASEMAFLKNFARFITGNNVAAFLALFSDAHYQIERNANAKILFTDLCFKVMRLIHIA